MMPNWKLKLLSLYYHGSYPYRLWKNWIASMAGKSPVMVLFYHRVADDAASGWTISNSMFARQMQWLKSNFDMVSLEEAQWRIRCGANHRPSISITFDDGYADNCAQALPLLLEQRIPCMYFVSTGHIFEGSSFPHDVAAGHNFAPNTIDQLRVFSAAGIEIGAHTRTHADLAQVTDPERMFEEVVAPRDDLKAALGCDVRYFAFPYGQYVNLDRFACHLAREAGYQGICSIFPATIPFTCNASTVMMT